MDKVKKAGIIKEFSEEFLMAGVNEYEDFFAYNDLGIPLSFSLFYGLATLTDEGSKVLDETYNNLCGLLEVEPTEEYEGYEDFREDSTIEDEEEE